MAGPRLNFAQVRLLGEAIKTPKGYQFPPAFGGSGGAGTGFTTASTVGSVIVGTLGTNGISMGVPAWLTAATAGGGGTGFTSASTAGSDIVATMGTNGLSMGIPAYLTTAMSSDASTAFAGNGFTTATTAGTAIVGTLSTNGLSMGIPAYLTTATAGGGAGTGFTTASTAGTDIVGTLDTNGLSMGIPAYLTAASAGGGGTGFTSASTAGSDIVATMGTNGLSMGVPAYLTTAQPPGAYLTTAMASDASSAFAGTNATMTGGSITVNTSGVSISLPAYLTTFAYPRLDQVLDPTADKVFSMGSNQLQLSWATGGSFSTNATRQGMFELDVAGNLTQEADAIHVHQHGGAPTLLDLLHLEADGANVTALRGQVGATVAAEMNQPIKFTTRDAAYSIGSVPMILGTQMSNSVANLNANFVQGRVSSVLAGTGFTTATTAGTDIVGTLQTNGLSMGVPAYLTAATAGGAGTGFTSTSTAGSDIVGTLNSNGLSVGVPVYLTTATAAANIKVSAGSVSTTGSAFTFQDSNGISFGLGTGASAGIITATAATNYQTLPPATLSYFANFGMQTSLAAASQSRDNSFYIFPISVPNNVSVAYARFIASFDFISTTIATSAVNNVTGASTAFNQTQAVNFVMYSMGTGANSRSLQYVNSASAGFTWAVSVSQQSTTNATQQSITQAITFPNEGNNTGNVTTQYSVSTTNGPISTTQWSRLSSYRWLDIPLATLVSPGVYFVAVNRMSGSVGSKSIDYHLTMLGSPGLAPAIGNINSSVQFSNRQPPIGLGTWTTNVTQTTSSIALSDMGVYAGTQMVMPYLMFVRQA